MGPYWRDLSERVLSTFVETFVLAFPAAAIGADWSTVKTAVVSAAFAGGTAVLSLLKGVAAQRRGNPKSASMARDV